MSKQQHPNLDRLRSAGVPVDKMTDAQREVIARLSPEEVDALVRIHGEMQQAVGTGQKADVGIVWY